MKLERILAIARKNLRGLKHDRRTLGFLVFMPLLMISIFGYTFGGSVEDIRVDIVNLDLAPANESFSLAVIEQIESRSTLKIVNSYGPGDADGNPLDVAREQVDSAKVWAAISFAWNFTDRAQAAIDALHAGETSLPSTLMVYIDGTNPNIVTAVVSELQRAVQMVLLGSGANLLPPIIVVPQLAYGQDAEFIDFFAPGVMGLAAMMVTFMLSIISFVHERTSGTLERLLTTPVTEGEIVAGYAIAFGLVALVQSIVIISAAVLLFDIAIQGSVLLVLAVVFIFSLGNQGLGFLLSSVAKNEFQAVQFMPLILFPQILLAGVFWPIEAVPEVLRPISYFLPLTYAVSAMRSVMIRGWGLTQIWPELTVLIVFAAAMLALSAIGLRRRG